MCDKYRKARLVICKRDLKCYCGHFANRNLLENAIFGANLLTFDSLGAFSIMPSACTLFKELPEGKPPIILLQIVIVCLHFLHLRPYFILYTDSIFSVLYRPKIKMIANSEPTFVLPMPCQGYGASPFSTTSPCLP